MDTAIFDDCIFGVGFFRMNVDRQYTDWVICRIFLMAFCTSLEGQTVASLAVYATSSFKKHSLISTVLVVQNVVNGTSVLLPRRSDNMLIDTDSCDQTPHGKSGRCLRPVRSILRQHRHLHSWIYSNGCVKQRSDICFCPNILRRWIDRPSDSSTSVYRR